MPGNSGDGHMSDRPSRGVNRLGRVVPQFPTPSGRDGHGDPRPDLESTGTGSPVDLLVSVGKHRGVVVPARSVDVQDKGNGVNAVMPGPIDTGFSERNLPLDLAVEARRAGRGPVIRCAGRTPGGGGQGRAVPGLRRRVHHGCRVRRRRRRLPVVKVTERTLNDQPHAGPPLGEVSRHHRGSCATGA